MADMVYQFELEWARCGTDWCELLSVPLENGAAGVMGVYVIWYGEQVPRTVRVGSGDVRDRLSKHRRDMEIIQYRQEGNLFVTWSAVFDEGLRLGIERYLADSLRPLTGEANYYVEAITVNLPI